MANEKRITCFISLSFGEPVGEATRRILHQLNVDTFTALDIQPGEVIASTVRGSIRAADFVCVILTNGPLSTNVAFETGLAVGLGKPVLALASQHALIPFDRGQGIQLIRLKADDPSSAISDIRRFVRHIKPRSENSPTVTTLDRVSTETVTAELDRLKQATGAHSKERALVDIVTRLFRKPGLEVMREDAAANGDRPDLFVWDDTLVAELGGPLIVECKFFEGASGIARESARRALQQLERYVEKSSASLGLLVFDRDYPTEWLHKYETPKALAFSIGELIDTVRADNLSDEIWQRRARATRSKGFPGDAG